MSIPEARHTYLSDSVLGCLGKAADVASRSVVSGGLALPS